MRETKRSRESIPIWGGRRGGWGEMGEGVSLCAGVWVWVSRFDLMWRWIGGFGRDEMRRGLGLVVLGVMRGGLMVLVLSWRLRRKRKMKGWKRRIPFDGV
jgi:hypothetical protein